MIDAIIDFMVYLFFLVGGLLFTTFAVEIYDRTFLHKKTNHFSWDRYLLYLFFPMLGVVYMTTVHGISVVWMYLASCVLGTICEWILGYTFHKVIGKRLWSYHIYKVGPYTSTLSLLIWGFGGILVWLLARVIFAF